MTGEFSFRHDLQHLECLEQSSARVRKRFHRLRDGKLRLGEIVINLPDAFADIENTHDTVGHRPYEECENL